MQAYLFMDALLVVVVGLYFWSRFKRQRDCDRYEAEAKLAVAEEQADRDDREEARQRRCAQSNRPVLERMLEHEPHLQTWKGDV